MSTKTLEKRIIETPDVCGGKPHISGHRITVQNIAIWHERRGWSVDRIANEYDLNLADIYTALAYYFAHREAIDKSIEESKTFIEEFCRRSPSILSRKQVGLV
jgi:uncharacterized protein (DUF433 family)